MLPMSMTNPTSCLKESHRNQVLCICTARHTETLNSQLEAELGTFVQGNPCFMLLSCLPWVFLAFIFSGRYSKREASILWFQLGFSFLFFFFFYSNPYTTLFIAPSLFSDFPHRIQCSPESYSKPARHFHSSWGDSHPELSIWDSSEPLSHFLVQTASQWRDDLPYWSWFF